MSAAEHGAPRPAPGRTAGRRRQGRRCWDFAHLAVLWAFALAQPLFNLLGKNPEFFAARGAPPFDVIMRSASWPCSCRR